MDIFDIATWFGLVYRCASGGHASSRGVFWGVYQMSLQATSPRVDVYLQIPACEVENDVARIVKVDRRGPVNLKFYCPVVAV